MTIPGSFGGVAGRGQDWLIRKVNDLEKKIDRVMTQRSLESAIIGRGGISIKGGALRVLDAITNALLILLDSTGLHVNAGGTVQVNTGGTVELNDGSTLNVNDGGSANLNDGSTMNLNDGSALWINDGGAVTFRTPAGHIVFQTARIDIPDGSGRTQQAYYVGRDDGTPVIIVADLGTVTGHTHKQNFGIYDRSGHIVFAEDANGNGLAIPYLATSFVDISSPAMFTSSGTFTPLQWADLQVSHPNLDATVLVQTPVGTAGEIRMTIGGTVIGSATVVPANSFTVFHILGQAVPGPVNIGDRVIVQLEARTTSGAGTIAARGISLWSVQAP